MAVCVGEGVSDGAMVWVAVTVGGGGIMAVAGAQLPEKMAISRNKVKCRVMVIPS